MSLTFTVLGVDDLAVLDEVKARPAMGWTCSTVKAVLPDLTWLHDRMLQDPGTWEPVAVHDGDSVVACFVMNLPQKRIVWLAPHADYSELPQLMAQLITWIHDNYGIAQAVVDDPETIATVSRALTAADIRHSISGPLMKWE